MPHADRARVSRHELSANTDLALAARAAQPWARQVPWPLFLHHVLPYASLDEPRDAWRPLMWAAVPQLVQGARSVAEAAQAVNKGVWALFGGLYFKADQTPEIMSPSQVLAAGYASCTGLSIFLVDALRAVGVPARVAGTPSWIDFPAPSSPDTDTAAAAAQQQQRSGQRRLRAGSDHPQQPTVTSVAPARGSWDNHEWNNHNWVEVWDGAAWSFVGAAEWDARGMNRTWFFPLPAKRSLPGSRLHAIYASTWVATPNTTTYPLVWNERWSQPAYDVTQSYLDARELQ